MAIDARATVGEVGVESGRIVVTVDGNGVAWWPGFSTVGLGRFSGWAGCDYGHRFL